MTLTLIPAVLLSALGLFAADSHDKAMDRLLKVEHFAFGGVGFAGVTSQGEKDYTQILARPSAAADFEKIYQKGNLQAKCYALAGLFNVSRDKYSELSDSLHHQSSPVAVMTGCIMSHQSVASVIDQIGAGAYSHNK
jgi:hypothetical protein